MIITMDFLARPAAALVPLAVAVVLVPFRRSMPNTQAALIMVVGIVAVAAFGELCLVSRMMAEGAEARLAVNQVEGFLAPVLDLRACEYDPSHPTGKAAILRPDGSVVLAGRRWPNLPGRVVDLPVEYGSHSYGRFAPTPTPGQPIPIERRRVAAAPASDVGAILAGSGTRREF